MNQNPQNRNCDVMNPSRPVMSRPSLFATLEQVKMQVEYLSFAQTIKTTEKMYIDPLYDELCLIIAEVLVRPPESTMRIRGGEIKTHIVQEVYRALTAEHVRTVYGNFKAQTTHIYNKAAYLQTSLYNAAFELNAGFWNGGY